MGSMTRVVVVTLAIFLLATGIVVWIVMAPGGVGEENPIVTATSTATPMAPPTVTPDTPLAPTSTPQPTAAIEAEPTEMPQVTGKPTYTPEADSRPEATPASTPAVLPTATPAEKPGAEQLTGRLIDYVRNSSDFVYIDRPHSPYRGMYIPVETVSGTSDDVLDTEFAWCVLVEQEPSASAYDCTIFARSYTVETRRQIEELLEQAYPTGAKQVMELVVLAIRQELWETITDHTSVMPPSGTFGTRYIDNREVHITYATNNTGLYILIKDPNYVNTNVPEKLNQEQIDDLSADGNGRSQSAFAKWFREKNGL